MPKAILKAESLSAGYNGEAVIESVDLSAYPGKIISLIGPNGAGKSTILKTLIRQLPPVSGTILLDGREMSAMTDREIARTVSAVLTGRPEPELMTCEDVVGSGRYPYTGRMGLLSADDRRIVEEAMDLVRVTDLRERDFNQISDGQRQRVMLARAICQEPKVLIMDEPTSFLDIKHKLDFLTLLKDLVRQRDLAVLLSLHELDLAQKYSDLVLCIRDSRIDRFGTPDEIFTGGYIRELYGIDHGSYNDLYGCIEPEPAKGSHSVFVLGGGGLGIPVYRKLQRMGIPFIAGILPENDLDFPVAQSLAAKVVTEKAFSPVSGETAAEALDLLKRCKYLILCGEVFGPTNEESRKLVAFAEETGMLVSAKDLEHLSI